MISDNRSDVMQHIDWARRMGDLEWRGRSPDQTKAAENFLGIFIWSVIAGIRKISCLQKRLLSYIANLRLQNDTNIDHVRLETEVQQPFKNDPMKIFNSPSEKVWVITPNFLVVMQ